MSGNKNGLIAISSSGLLFDSGNLNNVAFCASKENESCLKANEAKLTLIFALSILMRSPTLSEMISWLTVTELIGLYLKSLKLIL